MLANATSDIPFVEKRALRLMLLFYCLFILYGSFIPFRFSADPVFVHDQWMRFFIAPFVHGVRRFSILDVVSNVLLFVPFGFLWIGAEIGRRPFGRLVQAVLAVGLMGFLFGLGIETGQTFSPGRTASILDALSNGFGSALGGAAGYFFLRGQSGGFRKTLREIIRQRPSLILLGLLMVVPLAGAYYPFQITLDVSTVWDNLKHTQWLPFSGGLHRFWMDLLVEKILVFAAIGYLILRILRRRREVVFCRSSAKRREFYSFFNRRFAGNLSSAELGRRLHLPAIPYSDPNDFGARSCRLFGAFTLRLDRIYR